MSQIEEIPINSEQEIPINSEQENPAPEAATINTETPKAKVRGRPKGAVGIKKRNALKNEEEVAPKKETKRETEAPPKKDAEAPTKKAKKRKPPTPSSSSDQEEEPTREQHMHQIAAEVMHMLSNRHVQRSQAKREKYRSWFPQNVY